MILEEGTLVGSYTVIELLGAGGMGEVYRARDNRLKRDVAMKILSERLAEVTGALALFEREAQSVAALSHPNILAIHDFGRFEGLSYAVMELLEGETLRERLEQERLSARKAVDFAVQIVGGLIAAHNRGIVHRDLKPENLFLTRDGLVKILDFGLAQQVAVPETTDSKSTALTLAHNENGSVVGTVGYMSPEQIRARPVDHRTDIFSFGIVLYEMLSGQRPFLGQSSADVIGAILSDSPRDFPGRSETVSPALWNILNRCLEKNVDERFQTTSDLAFALRSVADRSADSNASGVGETEPQAGDEPSSVAVLRFSNTSPDPEQEYFCEGMAEEIINALAMIDGLKVAARSSAFLFDPKESDAREVGKRLKVKTVLEGSVRTAGKRVRVSVQLVDAVNGFQLWSERYDREMDDIFALQDEISERVVDALKVKLGGREKEDSKRPTASVEAYQLYLKGLHNWYKRETDSLEKAATFFEQAAEEDPSYTLAHAAVANAYDSLGWYGLEPRLARAKAHAAIQRALALDPQLAEVRAAVALKHTFLDWDWKGAEREFRAAIEANPSYVLAYIWFSMALSWTERYDEGATMAVRAIELDPLSPYAHSAYGLSLLAAGRAEEALAALNEAIEIDSDYLLTLWILTATHGALGRFDKAVAVAERAAVISGRSSYYLGWLGWAYGLAGRRADAEQILEELTSKPEGVYIPPMGVVQVHLGLGHVEEAFKWLDKAVTAGDPPTALLTLPFMDPLRDNPRFQQIRDRVGIPG
jgi:serine/threonine-protein kinase